jgi:hypothetical protein
MTIPAEVMIISPTEGDSVDVNQVVRGSLSRDGSIVQVFVFRGGKWYPQRVAQIEGGEWRVTCQFGDETTAKGASFKLIAISGAKETEEAVENLPSVGLRSNIVNVKRR